MRFVSDRSPNYTVNILTVVGCNDTRHAPLATSKSRDTGVSGFTWSGEGDCRHKGHWKVWYTRIVVLIVKVHIAVGAKDVGVVLIRRIMLILVQLYRHLGVGSTLV
jgi:hypothetical protein